MNPTKICVAKRTRNQRRKVDKQILEVAKAKKLDRDEKKRMDKALKLETDEKKRVAERNSRKSAKKKGLNDGCDEEAMSNDMEYLGEVYVSNEGGHKKIGAPSNSISISRDDDLVHYKDNMDPKEICVAKRTRNQCRKADEQILEVAKAKKLEKDKERMKKASKLEMEDKKRIAGRNSRKSAKKRGLNAGCDEEAMSSDIEYLGEIYPSNAGGHKKIGAPSRSNSISISSDDDLVHYKGHYLPPSDDVFDFQSHKEKKKKNQGRQEQIANCGLFHQDSFHEGNGDENQGRNVEICDPKELTLGSNDKEHEVDESAKRSEPKSDDLNHYREDNPEVVAEKDDESCDKAVYMETNAHEERVEFHEDEDRVRKKTRKREREDNNRGRKKKRGLGLDTTPFNGSKEDDEVRKSRLERLRPRKVFESEKNKPRGSGEIGASESDGSNELDDDSDSGDEMDDDNDVDYSLRKHSRKGRKPVGKQSKGKKCKSKNLDLLSILADSIWQEGDALKENLPPLEQEDLIENALPLKFRFEDEVPAPMEKDEAQKEVENLFVDLEMGWMEDYIGSTISSKEDNEAAAAEVTNPLQRCLLGYHLLILDEQIGVVCKYCGTVQQEIKHVLADLKFPTRKPREAWFYYQNDECSISHGYEFGDFASDVHHTLIHTEGPVLDIIPAALRRQMYPHQIDGFQFLWKNMAGATLIENMKTPLSEDGTGCIISHAPGTGKTFLTIVFLLTFMKMYPTCRPVIIAPIVMLRAWANELKRWKIDIPFHNLNDPELSGEENATAASIVLRERSSRPDGKRDINCKRMVKLYSWTKERSILGIGYNLFEKLAGQNRKGEYPERYRRILLELPSILILDEGHTARNDNSLLLKALTNVKTGRRIILSGTPFQNNFKELYTTFCLANPKFADCTSVKVGKNGGKSKSDLPKGKWASLTNMFNKNDNVPYWCHEELRAMMKPFVHVHKGTILQESLPGLKDTLVVLNPTDLQKQLLPKSSDNVLEKAYHISLVSVHPSLVADQKEFFEQKCILENLKTDPEAGVKTQFVIEIVRLSVARDEKVLVFCEFLEPLNFLVKQLTSYFSWEDGKQVLCMHGKLEEKQRQLMINSFNAHNSEAKVLLASTRACSEGINLVGASRVVLLNVVWNPSVERQAVSRAYRLGQKKFVYVYHLILAEKTEVEMYRQQAKKDRISELVFSSPDGHNKKPEISGTASYDKILEAMLHHEKLRHIFNKINDNPKELNVFENFDFDSPTK